MATNKENMIAGKLYMAGGEELARITKDPECSLVYLTIRRKNKVNIE